VYFSLAEDPNVTIAWTGEKLSATQVHYTSDQGDCKIAWPPAENVRVHAINDLFSDKKPAKTKTRLKHVAPAMLVDLELGPVSELLRNMGTKDWAEWCAATPTRTTIPMSYWPSWSLIVRRFLCSCNAAEDYDDFVDKALLFLALPKLYLDKKIKNQQLQDRLARHKPSVSIRGASPKYRQPLDADERAAKRCQELCDQGFFKKGVKALGKPKVLDGDVPEVRDVLESKHVAPTDGKDFILTCAPLDLPPYYADQVEKAVNQCANGSAPCWSGWTKELMNAACLTDPLLYHELAMFLHTLQKCVDPRLRSIVRTGLLVALDNAKHHTDPVDPRPITISEFFSKILGTLAMNNSKWHLHESQRGVCHKGGTHQAVVEVQTAYDTRPETIIATFDVRNAFNSTRRAAIQRKLAKMGVGAQHLKEYYRWLYGTPTDIYIRGADGLVHYRSREGVRQGDMPASLLFALAFTDAALLAAKDVFGDTNLEEFLWLYCDDVTVVGTVAQVLQFKERLEHHLAFQDETSTPDAVGLKLNMKKSRALVDRCTPEERDLLAAAGFQLDVGSTRVLGSPTGAVAACTEWVLKKVAGWQKFWELLRHEALRPVTALTLLKRCGNVKFDHLAKSLHPDVTRNAAHVFDEHVLASARAILAITTVADVAIVRGALHIEPYVVISKPLYESTLALIARKPSEANVKAAKQTAMEEHYKSLSSLPFVERHVAAVQNETASNTLYTSTPIRGQNAGASTTHHFAQGMRLRMGVLPAHLRVSKCDCGFVFGSSKSGVMTSQRIINHLLTCRHNRGQTTTTRHDRVLDAMAAVLFTYGHNARWRKSEMIELDPTGVLIPDLHVTSLLRQIIIDLTIVDTVHRGEEALDDASDTKNAKYEELAKSLGMRFFAVPISTYGLLHAEAAAFIEHVSHSVPVHRRSHFVRDMRCAIQHALLEGNSLIVENTVTRLSAADGNWV